MSDIVLKQKELEFEWNATYGNHAVLVRKDPPPSSKTNDVVVDDGAIRRITHRREDGNDKVGTVYYDDEKGKGELHNVVLSSKNADGKESYNLETELIARGLPLVNFRATIGFGGGVETIVANKVKGLQTPWESEEETEIYFQDREEQNHTCYVFSELPDVDMQLRTAAPTLPGKTGQRLSYNVTSVQYHY